MSRTFYVKLNLDAMAADLDTLISDVERLEWLCGFRAGARGRSVPEWTGARQMGCQFGLRAWQEAQSYRATRSAGGRAKAAKQKAENTDHPTSNNQQPEMHTICNAHALHMQQDEGDDASGDAPQTPASSRNPYVKCDAKFAKPEAVLSFEQTPAGIAALAKRAEIKARLAAKKEQHAS
jgi:hypothetical protein